MKEKKIQKLAGYVDIASRVYPELEPIGDELKRLHAENEELRRDAERYRWLREQSWYRSTLCVVSYPKEKIKPGTFCPNDSLLDVAIDAAMKDKKC